MTNLEETFNRLQSLKSGEQLVYGVWQPGPLSDVESGLKKAAWKLFMQGRVHLVQKRRVRNDVCATEYIAVGSTPPYKPVIFKGCYSDDWKGPTGNRSMRTK